MTSLLRAASPPKKRTNPMFWMRSVFRGGIAGFALGCICLAAYEEGLTERFSMLV